MLSFKEFIKETTTSAIGGLGFNTGNPAATPEEIANYVSKNIATGDTKNDIMNDHIKRHNGEYNKVNFDSYKKSKGKK